MKIRSPLSILAIIGIAAILLMPAQFVQSTDPPSDDYFAGTEGQDTFDGGHGNDRIFGKGSKDTLDGGEGDDFIHGGPSADVLRGGPGNDLIYGGGSGDKIRGGEGNDTIHGGGQGDSLYGGPGNDVINGGFQSDIIFGEEGNDLLAGGPGSDNIFGGVGDDILYGGPKNDNLFAGAGDVLENISTGTVTCASVEVGDTVTVNGLDYEAVQLTKFDNTEFSLGGFFPTDVACATDLADSIALDTRPGITEPSIDQTATSDGAVVTISAGNRSGSRLMPNSRFT